MGPYVLAGAGGIYSSINDLVKFVSANFDQSNKIFQLQQQLTHKINENMSIALGWHAIKPQTDNTSLSLCHDGGTAGFRAEVRMDVKNKNALVLLSNVSAFIFLKERY